MAEDYVRLKAGVITVGKPLLFNVFDAQGNLLLQQGYVISSHEQLDKLFARGLFHTSHAQVLNKRLEQPVVEEKKLNPFHELPLLLEELEFLLGRVAGQQDDSEKRLRILTRNIMRVGLDDPDACLAMVHLNAVEPSAYEQTLYHTILAFLIGQYLKWSLERVQALVQASLTANFALLPYQDKLNRSRNALSEVQRTVLRKHPDLSAMALEKVGIINPDVLAAVRQHHEQYNGSGYPLGLAGPQISLEAQVLGMTERYTAMISQRAYRPRMSVNQAQKELSHQSSDAQLFLALYAQLTPFPPGSFVDLHNGEVAVVTYRSRVPTAPKVRAIISARGSMYHGSFLRNTAEADFAINGLSQLSIQPSVNPLELWGS